MAHRENRSTCILQKGWDILSLPVFLRANAWIDHDKTRVGYEIPFNRHFYVFQPPRSLAEIDAEFIREGLGIALLDGNLNTATE